MPEDFDESLADLHESMQIEVKKRRIVKKPARALLLAIVAGIGIFLFEESRVRALHRQLNEERAARAAITREIAACRESLRVSGQEIVEKDLFLNTIAPVIGVSAEAATAEARQKRGTITVECMLKNAHQARVMATLQNVGFKYKPIPVSGTIPPNTVWFGSSIDADQLRLALFALIQGGIVVRNIVPFPDSRGRESVIRVGMRPAAAKMRPLSLCQIHAVRKP